METDAAKAFAVNPSNTLADKMAGALAKGAYSVPVKIGPGPNRDPTMSSYETPNFIHKKESVLNSIAEVPTGFILDPEVYLKSKFQEDLSTITAQIDKCKTKEDKIAVCKFLFIC